MNLGKVEGGKQDCEGRKYEKYLCERETSSVKVREPCLPPSPPAPQIHHQPGLWEVLKKLGGGQGGSLLYTNISKGRVQEMSVHRKLGNAQL